MSEQPPRPYTPENADADDIIEGDFTVKEKQANDETIDWESVNAPHEVTPSLESLAIGEAARELAQRQMEAEAAEKEEQAFHDLIRVKQNLGLQQNTDEETNLDEEIEEAVNPSLSPDEIIDAEFSEKDPEETRTKAYEGEPTYSVPAVAITESVIDGTSQMSSNLSEDDSLENVDQSEDPDQIDWNDVREPRENMPKKDFTAYAERLEESASENEESRQETERSAAEQQEGNQENRERTRSENREITPFITPHTIENQPAEEAPKNKKEKGHFESIKPLVKSAGKFAGWAAGSIAGIAAVAWPASVAVSTLAGTPVFAAAGAAASLTGPLALGLYTLMGAAFGIYCVRNLIKEWPTLKKEINGAVGRLFRRGGGKK